MQTLQNACRMQPLMTVCATDSCVSCIPSSTVDSMPNCQSPNLRHDLQTEQLLTLRGILLS